MSEIKVTSATITSAISELTSMNTQFEGKIEDLATTETSLTSIWEGEARDTFRTIFASDKEQMENFSSLLQEYITTLEEILTLYEDAEAINVETLTTRTY